MRITSTTLRRIIKEELDAVMNEQDSAAKAKEIGRILLDNEMGVKQGPSIRDVFGVPRANTAQGPYELLIVTNIERSNDPAVQKAIATLQDRAEGHRRDPQTSNTTVGFDRSGRLAMLVAGQGVYDQAAVLKHSASFLPFIEDVIQEISPKFKIARHALTYRMAGLPDRQTGRGLGLTPGPSWIDGLESSTGQGKQSGLSLELRDGSSADPSKALVNQDLMKAAALNDTFYR